MDVLFSIKPYFVNKILCGDKKYEYRKRGIKNFDNSSFAFVYSCKPQKAIVAAFPLRKILVGTPNCVWEQTKCYSGLEKMDFDRYYGDRSLAYAFFIEDLKIFDTPINPWQLDKNFHPPQSFSFLKSGDLYEKLRDMV